MLEGKELTFTTIAKNLNISSSHLTYHLDNLQELVKKTENGYQLSRFGEAAVEMTKTVETPPTPEDQTNGRKLRLIILVLSLAFLLITGVTIDLYGKSSIQDEKLEQLTDEVNSVSTQIGNYAVLDNLLETSSSLILVSRKELTYSYNIEANPPLDTAMSNLVMVFYAPEDNLTLAIESTLQVPDGFFVPLSVQSGNAFSNARSHQEPDEIGFGVWQSEVYWSENVSSSHQSFKITFADEGWYTLSWVGPVSVGEGGEAILDISWGSREMWTGVEDFKVWSYCQLIRQNDKVPFVVETELGSGANGISYLYYTFESEN